MSIVYIWKGVGGVLEMRVLKMDGVMGIDAFSELKEFTVFTDTRYEVMVDGLELGF